MINLSIIIPVYNVEQYLPQCLDSVFFQNPDNCEVICVNDGSPDNSRNILEDYRRKYSNMVIVDRENGGLSAARNSGFEIAKGKFIFFLDSDDYLFPGVLPKFLDYCRTENLDVLLFNAEKDTGEKYFTSRGELPRPSNGITFYEAFFKINQFFPPSVQWLYFYRKAFLDQHKIVFPEDNLQEDEPFTIKAFFHSSRVAVLDIQGVYHRVIRPGSITSLSSLPHLRDARSAWKNTYHYLKEHDCSSMDFYKKIFSLYQNTITKLSCKDLSKYRKGFFDRDDYKIMRACATDELDYKYYWYYKAGKRYFEWYSTGTKFQFLKHLLNKLLVLNYNFLKKNV